ncbi:unnamed protein product [Enterobius vermicularis]|uniref:Glycosyltransferase family 92 protein n=1 Tax=Enterobius vermicularis TaxID=51028 RepID=A0A0N4VLD2_ENTVE|nr:unnamed protein product [Enterobius vermicularis]
MAGYTKDSSFVTCTYEGKYGTADYVTPIPASMILNGTLKLYVYLKTDPGRREVLNVIDLRVVQREKKPHRLAVCTGPVWFYAEWTILPFFFEIRLIINLQTWIANGATKFYFYVNSITKEVDGIFRIYENDQNISVERVQWNLFPTDEDVSDEQNPNNLIYQVFVWNDCILRSKGNADYLALSDFDEIFVAFDNRTLLSALDNQLRENKDIASIMFQSTYGETYENYSNVTHPTQILFDNYKNISTRNKPYPPKRASKVIVIPERILSQHVHETIRTVEPYQKAMNELERCLVKITRGGRRKCLSYGICFPEIKSVRKEDWIYPRIQWAVL